MRALAWRMWRLNETTDIRSRGECLRAIRCLAHLACSGSFTADLSAMSITASGGEPSTCEKWHLSAQSALTLMCLLVEKITFVLGVTGRLALIATQD